MSDTDDGKPPWNDELAQQFFAWGITHPVPTRAVVKGFGAIFTDSSRIITMAWLAEGDDTVLCRPPRDAPHRPGR